PREDVRAPGGATNPGDLRLLRPAAPTALNHSEKALIGCRSPADRGSLRLCSGKAAARIQRREARMVQVTVQLPDEIAQKFSAVPGEIPRRILESVAAEGFRSARLSRAQVG